MGWLPKKLIRHRLKKVEGRLDALPNQRRISAVSPFSTELNTAYGAMASPVSPRSLQMTSDDYPAQARQTYTASIILPVYNEQACIAYTYDAVLNYANAHPNYTFIFVNDGSTDATATLLETRIAQTRSDRMILISYLERGGKGYAVRRGVEVADSDYICFLDGDLAYTLDHLEIMLSKLEWYEVVIGSRSLAINDNKELKPIRRIAGKIFNTLSRRILNLHYVDMQAGLKGFQKSAAKHLFELQELTGFSFDVELIYLARKQGYAIAEIPARVSSSHHRKLSKVNLLLDSLKMLQDLLRIRLNDWFGHYE